MEHIPMITGIPLRKINARDTRFRISYPPADEMLLLSVEKVGIVQPVVLREGQFYSIVTGFRRVEAARKLGLKEIPAVTAKLGEKEGLLLAIHDNIHRRLNLIEKAHAVEKMTHMGFPESEIYEIMTLFSLGAHEKILSHLLSIAGAEEAVKRFIVEQALSMKSIEYLFLFEKEERRKIIRALAAIRLTESYIREILEMLNLIKIRKGRFPGGILTHGGGAHEMRTRLKKIIRPGLSSLEKQLEKTRKATALPPALDIKVDPFFEKEYIDITLRAKSEEEIQELIRKLNEVLRKGHIRSILDLTKGRVR